VETPRLLLASGLGNDQVGKNLQSHVISSAVGSSPVPVPTFSGPGQSVGTLDFAHAGGAPYGGGALFDLPSPYPLQLAQWADAFDGVPAYGREHKRWLRRSLGRIVGVMAMGQEVPLEASRVTLDRQAVDDRGMPAARLVHARHPETDRVRRFLDARCVEWLDAAGCAGIVDLMRPTAGDGHRRRSPGSEHSAGTVRMGTDPSRSAAGPDGLVHGCRNVHVADGSLLPTNGSVNPTLTLLANALRVADGLT
jgi:choline dehydrogenase-like flavoprotein